MIRTFIAIDPPQEVIKDLEPAFQTWKALGKGVKWISPSRLHLTLKFLGDVPEDKLELIESAACAATKKSKKMTLSISGTGVFPNPGRPRIFWVGLKGDLEALTALQEEMETALEEIGYEKENRKFSPHITVGRLRRVRKRPHYSKTGHTNSNIESILAGFLHYKLETRPFTISQVVIYKSDLKSQGPIYTTLATCPLKEG